jgi:elongation factor Tu
MIGLARSVVIGIEQFHKELEVGKPGDNLGLLLRGLRREDALPIILSSSKDTRPGSIKASRKCIAQVYILSKEEGGRHTPFLTGYTPQFFFRTADVTGTVKLGGAVEMALPGDHLEVEVEFAKPVPLYEKLRFAMREGGLTVGAGSVSSLLD